jgi:copper resistance protein B
MKTKMTLVLAAAYLAASPLAMAASEDDPLLYKVMLDQLELRESDEDAPLVWEADAWIGKDLDKLWIKTEGERSSSDTEKAEVQLLYSKAIAPFWDLQIGARHDFLPKPDRDWATLSILGLAPYFFEIDTALFVGKSGRTALRFQAEYELMLSQRLILTPEIELNLYGKDDPSLGIGSGLSDTEVGLRLRYEIRREFAPYIGINWSKLFGDTADFAHAEGEDTEDTQFVVGVRAWF